MTERTAAAGIILVAATWMSGAEPDLKVGMVAASCLCVAVAMVVDLVQKRRKP